MKPNILVLYYSQTGQLRHILDNILVDIKDKANIEYAHIDPVNTYKLPWKASKFFDVMPETVQHIPIVLQSLPDAIKNKHYDLVY